MTVAACEAVLTLDLSEPLRGGPGTGQGGAIAALVEAAARQVARSRMERPREVSLLDLHVSYLHEVGSERVVATAHTTGGGRTLCFCEVRVEDAQGHLCAQAMVTLRYRDPG